MMKSLLVISTIALSLPAFSAGVCESQDKATILRHFFGASADLKSKQMKTLARQFRDSTMKIYPSPDDIKNARVTIPTLMKIRGVQKQMGFYPGAYRYDVMNEGGVAVIEVRVQLKDGTPEEKMGIAYRLQGAENIWNMTRPRMGFEYKFRFKLVDTKNEAHYRVHVKKNTRGPYFKNWDSNSWWTAGTQAHEMGHMLGLSDEYEGISGSQKNCSTISMWCNDEGSIEDYHYYFILRRIVMQAEGCKFKDADKDSGDDEAGDEREI